MSSPKNTVNTHHKTWQDKLTHWWHMLPKNTKIIYVVIALVVVGAGVLGIRAYNDQLTTQRYRILDSLLTQYGYAGLNSSLCEEGNDVVYKDENGEEQKIYGEVTGNIFEGDDVDAIRKKLRDAKYTELCDSLNDEYRVAVSTYDIDKAKEILAKVSAAKKEALKRKNAEVEIARGQKAEDDKERQARTNTFDVVTRDGYSYQVTYELAKEPAVSASIDTSKGKPGYAEVAMNVYVNSWSITNTTKGKKAPCLTGLAVAPLYSAAMGSLFDEVKKDSGDSYTYEATLSGKRYTTFNGRVDSSTVGLGTFATQSGDCTIEPDGAIRSTDKKMVTLSNGGIIMREDLAKRFVELIKQPEGYVVRGTDSNGTYRNTTTVYGEIDGSSDTPIIHIAKGFKS